MPTLPLADSQTELLGRIKNATQLLLFSDFDGTLVPISNKPMECKLTAEVAQTLTKINQHPNAIVGIVSGRELPDLQPRVGIDGLAYAGNHGLEIVGPGYAYNEPQSQGQVRALMLILNRIAHDVAKIPGAWVQNKFLSASVHYREVAEAQQHEVIDIVTRLTQESVDAGQFTLRPGKMVVEIRPNVDWNKGRAVEWLTKHLSNSDNVVSLFLGDDRTDEDAFELMPDGITILVGPDRETHAKYRVDDYRDVANFLKEVENALPGRSVSEAQ